MHARRAASFAKTLQRGSLSRAVDSHLKLSGPTSTLVRKPLKRPCFIGPGLGKFPHKPAFTLQLTCCRRLVSWPGRGSGIRPSEQQILPGRSVYLDGKCATGLSGKSVAGQTPNNPPCAETA